MAREVVWHKLFCRGSGCGVMFYICGSCYRGQVYCGDELPEAEMQTANRHRQRQTGNTRTKLGKDGSITGTGSGPTGHGCRLRRVTDAYFPRQRDRSGTIEATWTETGNEHALGGGIPVIGPDLEDSPKPPSESFASCAGVWA